MTKNWAMLHQRIVTKVQKPQRNQWSSNSDKELSQNLVTKYDIQPSSFKELSLLQFTFRSHEETNDKELGQPASKNCH